MAQNEKEPATDFNDLEQVTRKYLALKALVADCTCECTQTTLTPLQANKAQEEPSEPVPARYAHALSNKTPVETPPYAFRKTAACPEEFSVEAITTLEKHRLSIWLAKFAVVLIALIVIVLLLSTVYFVISANTMPDATLLGAIVANLNDVVLAVLNAGKVP